MSEMEIFCKPGIEDLTVFVQSNWIRFNVSCWEARSEVVVDLDEDEVRNLVSALNTWLSTRGANA